MSKRGSLSTRTMVDFKSTPLEPLAFKARVVQCFASLMRRERRLPAELDAVCDGARPAFARAGADQIALELGQAAEHGQHQPPMRCGGVGPRVAERSESGLLVGDRRQYVEKVARRSRQAIEPRHHKHVAGVELVEDTAELGAVGLRAAGRGAVDLLRASRAQLPHRRVNALAVRRYPCIAPIHEASFLDVAELTTRNGRFARCASPSM